MIAGWKAHNWCEHEGTRVTLTAKKTCICGVEIVRCRPMGGPFVGFGDEWLAHLTVVKCPKCGAYV